MGIGLACCTYLLEAGVMNLVMGSRNVQKGEEQLTKLRRQYPRACLCYCQCDVTNAKDMKNIFSQAKDLHGCIDIVVNNAGILNEAAWEATVDTNIKGTIMGLQLAMNIMSNECGGKGGVIVNMASILGMQSIAGAPVYVGTKHFVIGFTRSYGMPYHFKKSKVRVMAMCPGVTVTPLVENVGKNQSPLAKQAAKELGELPKQEASN